MYPLVLYLLYISVCILSLEIPSVQKYGDDYDNSINNFNSSLHDKAVQRRLSLLRSQCLLEDRQSRSCLSDKDYGIRHILPSNTISITMSHHFSMDLLLANLGDMDDEQSSSNSPLAIRIIISKIQPNFDEMELEIELDQFLIPRPWWKIVRTYHSQENTYTIIFERYPIEWRSFLGDLVKTQYLSSNTCSKTPLIISRMDGIHPGMGSTLSCQVEQKKKYPNAVSMLYWPLKTAFASENDCPSTSNKWNCVWLSMTNCSTPNIIKACQEYICLSNISNGLDRSIVMSSATETASIIHDASELTIDFKSSSTIQSPPGFKIALPSAKLKQIPESEDSYISMYIHLFVLRPNAFLRLKMKKLIHEFHIGDHSHHHHHLQDHHLQDHHHHHSFQVNTPCITAHIRRGDRTKTGLNMTEWCSNYTHDNNPTNIVKKGCVNVNPQPHEPLFGNCPSGDGESYNFGCVSVPFDAITLSSVISKASRLIFPVIYDILVFTDDPITLQHEISQLPSNIEFRIHTLKSPPVPENININNYNQSEVEYLKTMSYYRFGAGVDSGVLLASSFKLAQQCSAFIGHLGSSMSRLFHQSMCIEHATRYGVCPPTYDYSVEGL